MTAIGVAAQSYREVPGCGVITSEDGAGWSACRRALGARGRAADHPRRPQGP